MENDKNNENKIFSEKVLIIISIVLSIISITISAFALGNVTNHNKENVSTQTNSAMPQNCPMQYNCPMQDLIKNGMREKNNFMPMWSRFNTNDNNDNDNDNNTIQRNNAWRNNRNVSSSSNAKRKIGGYSPNNKAYDKKPMQDIDEDQSPQEYKTYDAPDNSYGEKLKERERIRREKRESIATREKEGNED